MPLPVPNLDDRRFPEIMNEARSRIPIHCPEWSDHNLSDPGITLVELFAWMTELILYRLNKVPEKNFIKFLDLLGVTLNPASPATTDLTFRLSAPLDFPLRIDRGTEIATRRTETEDAIVFTTDQEMVIAPSMMRHILVSHDLDESGVLRDQLDRFKARGNNGVEEAPAWELGDPGVGLFQDVPRTGDAFYLGYSPGSPIKNMVLAVSMDFAGPSEADLEQAGVGIIPSNPPLRWEYWDGVRHQWWPFERREDAEAWLESDGTMGLSQSGQILLHIPGTAGVRSLTDQDEREAYWVRCLDTPFTDEHGEHGAYQRSPRLRAVLTQAIGGTARASNAYQVVGEVLGISNGMPGQSKRVSRPPLLPPRPGETVQVETDNGWEDWTRRDNFADSKPYDKHFVCDLVSGEILFGPAVRSPRGEEVRYGATPPLGRHVRLSSYRYGGGPAGNVGRDTITVPKSKIPYVDEVTNRRAATGGADPESVEHAKMRGPQVIRNLQRAVTPQDFEDLAKAASTSVGRAHCVRLHHPGIDGGMDLSLDARNLVSRVVPGVVQVLIVPSLARNDDRQMTPRQLRDQLQPSDEILNQVRQYLEDRRLLTTLLVVGKPDYVWVSVSARVKVSPGNDHSRVKEEVEKKLNRFIHPLWGGFQGDGWPFGRDLFLSELYSQIQSVAGVEYIDSVDAFPVDPNSEERIPAAATGARATTPSFTGNSESSQPGWSPPATPQIVSVSPSGLLCSWYHNVTCF